MIWKAPSPENIVEMFEELCLIFVIEVVILGILLPKRRSQDGRDQQQQQAEPDHHRAGGTRQNFNRKISENGLKVLVNLVNDSVKMYRWN